MKKDGWGAKLPEKLGKDDKGEKKADQYYDAKYTNTDEGQQIYGTFSDKGMQKFEELTATIKKQQKEKKKEIAALESAFLALLKEKHKKTGKAVNNDKRCKRHAGDGDTTVAKCKKQDLVFDDDDDEEGDDDGDDGDESEGLADPDPADVSPVAKKPDESAEDEEQDDNDD